MSEEKPAGYFSRAARAQRSEAWNRRRQESAAKRDREQEERASRNATIERRLAPVRAYATAKLARVPDDRQRHDQTRRAVAKEQRGFRKGRRETIDRFDHANYLGTPETMAHASRTRQGALARLYEAGGIDAEQLAAAMEIAQVAEQIERDVEVRTASFETRVDNSGAGYDPLIEGIKRVRHHMAYTAWRDGLPHPKRAILDMILGEPIPFSTAARRYRMGKARAKKLLIDALDAWPGYVSAASKEVDAASLAAFYAGLC